MSTSGNRSLGTGILVVGWLIVVAGAVVVLTAIGDHSPGRDERAGVGLAMVMSGMLVVLAGNYVHHRSLAEDEVGADRPPPSGDGRRPPG